MSPTLKYKKDGAFTSTGGAGGGGGTVTVDPYVRPADWLALPAISVGDQKVVGLFAVYDHDSNFVAMNCAGAYTVNWGDGVVENFAANAQANHKYAYSAVGNGTLSARGYRQVIITVTPQAGQNLTKVDLSPNHNQSGLYPFAGSPWLDIRMAGSLVSTLTLAGFATRLRWLEQFEYVGTNAITSFVSLFSGFSAFQSLVALDTSKGTGFNNMFTGCRMLQTIPLINTASGVFLQYMFSGCTSLRTIPLLNTAEAIHVSGMFENCKQLRTVPLLNTSKATHFSTMFKDCGSLESIPLLNTSTGQHFLQMFMNCAALQTVPLLDTAAGTTVSSMFSGCSALTSVPLLNTATCSDFSNMFYVCGSLRTIPLLNTAVGTNFTGMFSQAASLIAVPALNTAAGKDFSSMFNGCVALEAVPPLNTSAGTNFTSMFQNCTAMQTAPSVDLSSATTLSQMFNGCPNLRGGAPVGPAVSISYAQCTLGPVALNNIYERLGTGWPNMLSANAASVETSAADWSVNVVNCTVARYMPGANPPDGSYAARMTTANTVGEASAAITNRIAVLALKQYTFLAKMASAGTYTNLARISIGWYDASGTLISTDASNDIPSVAAKYQQHKVTAVSPAGAVTASLILGVSNTTNAIFDWDAFGLYPADTPTWTPGGASTGQTITVTGNWGVATDNPSIATAKGWTVTG